MGHWQPDWRSVAEQDASAGTLSADALRQRMEDFAESVARLPTLPSEYDIPAEILDRLRPGIDATARGLENAAQNG